MKPQMDREAHITRAKQLLESAKHAAMATVNEDGSPHNTPFMFLYEPDLSRIYWGSHPRSVHSKNVTRTGEAFFVWFDAEERGGLYIKAKNAHELSGGELEAALMIHNKVRAARGQDLLKLSYYTGQSPQRMWSATPTAFWVNGAIRDEEGHMAEDIRMEVTVKELVS